MVKNYAPVFVFADRESLFSQFTTSNMVKNECVTLCQPIHDEMCVLAHTIISSKENFMVVFGGSLNTLSLACLLNLSTLCDKVFVMGELGLALALIKLKIWNLGRLTYLKIHREIMIKVLEKLEGIDTFAQFILPKGFLYREKTDDEGDEKPEKKKKPNINQTGSDSNLDQSDLKNVPLDGTFDFSSFPKDSEIIEFNAETWQALSEAISESEKILFVENPLINFQFNSKIGGPLNDKTFNPVWLAPPEKESKDKAKTGIDLSKLNKETPMQTLLKNMVFPKSEPVFSEKFKEILVSLNRSQQLKKLNIKADMGGDDPWHDFEHDLMVTMIGSDLEDLIETLEFEIVELEKKADVLSDRVAEEKSIQENNSQNKQETEFKEEISKGDLNNELEFSQEPEDEFLAAKPMKKIYEVADFYIKDSEFVLRILSGEEPHGLNSVHEYPMTIPEDDNDFGYIKLI